MNPSTGRTLWSDWYERPVRDALVLQAEVVRALAVSLHGTLPPEARERLAAVRTVNPLAYEEYLKGRYQWNRRTRESLQLAVAHFTRAVELDPTYAPAHAALADCYNQLGTVMVGAGPPVTYRPLAAAAASRRCRSIRCRPRGTRHSATCVTTTGHGRTPSGSCVGPSG